MNPEVAKLSYRAIIDYLGGHYEEYQRLIEQALTMHQEVAVTSIGNKAKCVYIKNKQRINAVIDWQTGVVTDENGTILRRVNKC